MKLGRALKKILKKAPSMIGTVAGTMLGGPMGGTLGGALGGAVEHGKGNKLSGAMHGAMMGLGYNAMAPSLASGLGMNGPMMSSMTGLNSPSLLNQFGMSGAPSMGGGIGLFGNSGNMGLLDKFAPSFTKKLMGNALKSLSGPPQQQEPQQMYGMQDYPAMDTFYGETVPGRQMHSQHHGSPEFHFNMERQRRGQSPLDILMQLSPNIPFSKYRRSDRHRAEPAHEQSKQKEKPAAKFARGGVSSKGTLSKKEKTGYIKESDSGGQDDDIKMTIPKGAYVMNATDVSLLGDGSSENGVKKLKEFESKFLRSGICKSYDDNSYGIKALVSNDEYVLNPRTVSALGKGDNQKGAKVMDKMRKNLRKQKGVKSILPPKSKNIEHYIRGGK